MKSTWPVKIDWWGVDVVICLARGADCLHMVQLMPLPSRNAIVSCLISVQAGFTFLVPAYRGCQGSKGKGSPYSITERRVPELIPVLGSQPAGDVNHKPGGRLPLLSTRPAVTPATLDRAATSFAAWWPDARWVWTVCLRLLPDSVAAAIWTHAFCAWVQHADHSATEPPLSWKRSC